MENISAFTTKSWLVESKEADNNIRRVIELAQQGGYPRALDQIEKAIETDPHCAPAWHEKGNCLDEPGRCEEALSSYDTAINLDPHHAEAWFNKGLTLKKMGLEKEAYVCMNRGVDLTPGR